jgi:hypothetical protein
MIRIQNEGTTAARDRAVVLIAVGVGMLALVVVIVGIVVYVTHRRRVAVAAAAALSSSKKDDDCTDSPVRFTDSPSNVIADAAPSDEPPRLPNAPRRERHVVAGAPATSQLTSGDVAGQNFTTL